MTALAEAPPKETKASCSCDHCGLAVPAALIDEAEPLQFCCGGCRTAYEVIHGCGLEEYYRLREIAGEERERSTGSGDHYSAFDSEAFQEKHVTRDRDDLARIELRLEGVHCAACVWLVERLPSLVDGVVEARLSLSTCSARVAWDPEVTTLSRVAHTLDRLGYAPHPARDTSARDARLATERRQLTRMAIAGALAGNNMLIALALYAGFFEGIDPQHAELFRWVSMAIGWLSVLGPGATFFRSALTSLRTRTSRLDQPIALALAVGLAAGTVNVVLGRGEVYFDSLSVLVFLLLVGRFLQARQQRWATDAVGMAVSMTPDSCRVLRNGRATVESVEALGPGDTVEVLPGEVFPADGRIVSGASSIDASLLTGESVPRPVHEGDEVYSGAVNVSGKLCVEVVAVGAQTRIGQLQQLVMDGLHARTPLVQMTDRIGRWFLSVIVVVALVNTLVWAFNVGLAEAIDSSAAVLIVACPCALGLATPLTMAMAIGRASRQGVLIKSAHAFERLASVNRGAPGVMMIDKTGTLTRGEFEVVEWLGDRSLIGVVGAAERQSLHPIGRALSRFADSHTDDRPALFDCHTEHGYGLACNWGKRRVVIGSPDWVAQEAECMAPGIDDALDDPSRSGLTRVAIAVDGRVVGLVLLRDQPYAETDDAVRWLSQAGWRLRVLSGDNQQAVDSLCSTIGIDATEACGRMTPEAKFEAVRDAVRADTGAARPTTVMIGDGVNDAAALAAADVGVAVHGGAEAALAAADVYLSRPGVSEVVGLIGLAKRTLSTVRRNLVISLAYNVLAVALACGGWLNPLAAAVLMPLSSATVLASAIGGVALADGDKKREPGD